MVPEAGQKKRINREHAKSAKKPLSTGDGERKGTLGESGFVGCAAQESIRIFGNA
jgi:hypothetical protein